MKMIEPAGPSFENGRRELEVGEIPEVEALSMGKSSKCWVFPCYPCHVWLSEVNWQCINVSNTFQHHILLDVNPGLRSSPFERRFFGVVIICYLNDLNGTPTIKQPGGLLIRGWHWPKIGAPALPTSLDGKRDMIACRICVYFLRRATISSPGEVETTGWSTAGILFYYWYKIGHDRRMRGLFIRFKLVPIQYISLCVFSFRIGEWMSPRANRAARTCFRIKIVSWWWSKSVFFLATWRWVHRWILPVCPGVVFVLKGVSLVKMTG